MSLNSCDNARILACCMNGVELFAREACAAKKESILISATVDSLPRQFGENGILGLSSGPRRIRITAAAHAIQLIREFHPILHQNDEVGSLVFEKESGKK